MQDTHNLPIACCDKAILREMMGTDGRPIPSLNEVYTTPDIVKCIHTWGGGIKGKNGPSPMPLASNELCALPTLAWSSSLHLNPVFPCPTPNPYSSTPLSPSALPLFHVVAPIVVPLVNLIVDVDVDGQAEGDTSEEGKKEHSLPDHENDHNKEGKCSDPVLKMSIEFVIDLMGTH